jgi:hypothetical protein
MDLKIGEEILRLVIYLVLIYLVTKRLKKMKRSYAKERGSIGFRIGCSS